MALINWNPSLIINIRRYDEQHEILVRLINQLYETIVEKNGSETLCASCVLLTNTIEAHLADEVNLLLANGYPDLAEQKIEYEKPIRQSCLDLRKQLESGGILELSTLALLSDWIINHIWRDAKLYAPFLNAPRGVSTLARSRSGYSIAA